MGVQDITDIDSKLGFAIVICKKIFNTNIIEGDVYIDGILSVVSSLKESYQNVLRLRYYENKTYREIGNIFHLSVGRIQQIESKIFHMLKHPSRSQKMRVSYIIAENNSLKAELKKVQIELQKAVNRCDALEQIVPRYKSEQLNTEIENRNVMNTPIADLNISVRLYNCLLKTGISNIEGITELKTYDDIVAIRHLGMKCAYELLSVMKEKGFDEWAKGILESK